MAFKLVRELLDLKRDNGAKRLLLALYNTDTGIPYLALSEQVRESDDGPYISNRKGITVRRSELQDVITALKAADFDAPPDNKSLSNEEYATQVLDAMIAPATNSTQG